MQTDKRNCVTAGASPKNVSDSGKGNAKGAGQLSTNFPLLSTDICYTERTKEIVIVNEVRGFEGGIGASIIITDNACGSGMHEIGRID